MVARFQRWIIAGFLLLLLVGAVGGPVLARGTAQTISILPTPTTPSTVVVTPTPPPTPTTMPTAYPTPTTIPQPPPPAPPPSPPGYCANIQGYHTIRPGETLYAIGRAYATQPSAIAMCNNILNPNRVYVGFRLGIPLAPWYSVPPGPTAQRQFTPGTTPPPQPSPGCRYQHMVQRGETLTLLGLRYNVSIWSIARANNIRNLNLIYVGQTLCIP